MGELDVSDVAPSSYVATGIEQTGSAVHVALPEHVRPAFERAFRAALAKASETFDLAPVQQVVDNW